MSSGSEPGEMIECPADGCDYTNLRTSVLAHYSGKQDDTHKGGYLKAQERMQDADVVGRVETDRETDPADKPVEKPAEAGSEDEYMETLDSGEARRSNPLVDPVTNEPTDDESEWTCPECGSPALVDYRGYSNGDYHEINDSQHYVGGDFLCPNCRTWWVDE